MRHSGVILSAVTLIFVSSFAALIIPAIPRGYLYGDELHIELRNTTDEAVLHGHVSVFGKDHEFGRIEPAGTMMLSTRFRGEGGYSVHVEFESGKQLTSGSLGYLTNGISSRDRIAIGREAVLWDESEVK